MEDREKTNRGRSAEARDPNREFVIDPATGEPMLDENGEPIKEGLGRREDAVVEDASPAE